MLLVNFLFLLLVLPSVQPKSTYKNAENETQKLKKTDVTAISVYLDAMSRDLAQIKGQVEEIRVEMSSVKSQNSVLLGLMKLVGIEYEKMEDESGEDIKMSKKRCPLGFNMSHHKSCYMVVAELATWVKARAACREHRGDLLGIETESENSYILGQLNSGRGMKHCDFWTSGSDAIKEGMWMWESSSKPLKFTNWQRNEPNNGNGREHCLWMDWYFGWKWNDADCHRDRACYVCESNRKRYV